MFNKVTKESPYGLVRSWRGVRDLGEILTESSIELGMSKKTSHTLGHHRRRESRDDVNLGFIDRKSVV